MRVTVLTYLEAEDGSQQDVVVDQVADALRQCDHQVSVLGVHGDLSKLISGLRRRQPDLIFNLMEMFGDNVRGDVGVAGVLDLLGIPYTGAGPGECYIQQDKAIAKKLLAFDKIQSPPFAVFFPDAALETAGNLRMPLFVKPLRTDASIGIGRDALVYDTMQLLKRVTAIRERYHDAALAEEYIEGREFYVGVLGNRQAVAFPPMEMDFSGLKDGQPHIMDQKAKFAENSAEFKGTKAVLAEQIPEEFKARLEKTALDAYRALHVRDYGRVDLRVAPTNDIYVLEVNANCYLERSSEFATAAAAAGHDYPTLINRIAELALERRKNHG